MPTGVTVAAASACRLARMRCDRAAPRAILTHMPLRFLAGLAFTVSVASAALPACGSSDAATQPASQAGNGGAAGADDAGQDGASAGDAGAWDAAAGSSGEPHDAAPEVLSEATADAPNACVTILACDAAAPAPGPAREWNHWSSTLVTAAGAANHRGRDLFLNPGEPQWVIAKFAYGLIDKDLKDEEVDIYLLRDCAGSWEKLGTAATTDEGAHATIEGVEDSGGRVYFEIPESKKLGLGRHRLHLVVAGDLSTTELFVEVVPPGRAVFVSDVDGTLTTEETEEYQTLLTGQMSQVRPSAPEAMSLLVARGYRPFYMTARPEWLVGRTREFLQSRGFPPGVVHTTTGKTGALGSAASGYKTAELQVMTARGLKPRYAFGNTETDAEAYFSSGIEPAGNRVFMQYSDTAYGGRRIESYAELLPEFSALESTCP
jgi:hypothetical protein